MLQLSSPFKIVPLAINCDTLVLTFSPHYQVIHHHFYSFEETTQILKRYQQTHRICIVADTYEEGANISKKIKQMVNQQLLQPKNFQYLSTTPLKLISQNMLEKKQNSSNLPNIRSMVNKIQRQIECLSKQIVKQRLEGQDKKTKSKALKIKEKKLNQLQCSREKLKKQLQDRAWMQKQKLQNDQDQYLLQWLQEYQQEEQLENQQN